jgi:APA family basic amino acid/polyamine antiporter
MNERLRRELGLGGAVVTGLGSILGTGVFVSIAVAAGFAGSWILLAVPAAAIVASFNGLSSAQLAAAHPVSGGTYEYGNRFLGEWWGFSAGWLFLVAKTASAATAALGFGAYLLAELGEETASLRLVAMPVALGITALVAGGIRRTARLNAVLVTTVIAALVVFIAAGVTVEPSTGSTEAVGAGRILEAIAFLFVAYTGYGRIATLGEEVRDPRRTIPRAVVVTLVVSAVLYLGVAWSGIRIAGPAGLSSGADTAALRTIAPWGGDFVALGALVAMAGVLVNLILGLSRVWLAMARRGDAPRRFARLGLGGSPTAAVWLSGSLVALVALVGDVRATWSFSAVTVLLYYAITNLAALRLADEDRLTPRWTSVAGLVSCAFLALWIDPAVWAVAALIGAIGATGRILTRRFSGPARSR